MTVALGTTLINLKIHDLLKFGHWTRIEDAITTGTDMFIGAGVTRHAEASPYIDLCSEIEALTGILLGYNKQVNTIDSDGYYYRDFDNPFAASKKVLVGIPIANETVNLILSETNTTIAIDDKLKCVDGVFKVADTNDNFQYLAEEAVAAAANTRKYLWARFIKA